MNHFGEQSFINIFSNYGVILFILRNIVELTVAEADGLTKATVTEAGEIKKLIS